MRQNKSFLSTKLHRPKHRHDKVERRALQKRIGRMMPFYGFGRTATDGEGEALKSPC